jgi:hypothetical protein
MVMRNMTRNFSYPIIPRRPLQPSIQIEFDCAHGTIYSSLGTDAQGRFDMAGTFVREGAGPIRVGRTPGAWPPLQRSH